MERACVVPVLIAVADLARRSAIVRALGEAGFEVWQAEDFDDALTKLHGSPRHLVVLVDPGMAALLHFAASDRRLTCHHLYLALTTAEVPHMEAPCHLYPCLTLWELAPPTTHELIRLVTTAAHVLDGESAMSHELVAR